MFSKKRKQQDVATKKGLGIAVKQEQSTTQRPPQPWTAHERTMSSSTTASSTIPMVSPLRMTFDFEVPPSPALSQKPSLEAICPPSAASSTRRMDMDIPPPPEPRLARYDTDNISSSSNRGRRKSRIKSFFGFDPPPEIGAVSRPSSSSGAPPRLPSLPRDLSLRPATSSGSLRMESSLFPSKRDPPPALPPFDASTPPITREWLDARDRPYSSAHKRPPPPPLQIAKSSPDLAGAKRSPSTNFSTRTPATDSPLRPNLVSASTSPVLQRPPSHAASTSTTRTGKSSRTTMMNDSPTVGRPYGETSPAFPPPQLVSTRPKTAGNASASTIGGVTVPTHHTSAQQKPSEKSEKRKTRYLNPIALLSRRKSAQEEDPLSTAQAAALARQRNIAVQGGVKRQPDDFDPRIRGSLVHDFSAPRRPPTRVFTSDEAESLKSQPPSARQPLQSTHSAPFLPPPPPPPPEPQDDGRGRGPRLTFVGQSFRSPSRDSSRKRPAGAFQEHLNDNESASGGVRAERLENKDFVQRASVLSGGSGSSESAVLPVFARRSQHWDDSFGDQRVSSGGTQRDSGLSSLSGVSPVTASSPARMPADARASLSPVSPTSGSASNRVSDLIRPLSEVSEFSNQRVKSSGGISLPEATLSARQRDNQDQELRQPSPISISIPSRPPPEIPPRGIPLSPHMSNSPAMSIPSLSSNAPTPEPQLAEAVVPRMAVAVPRLVEKRASAVGHSSKKPQRGMSNGIPKHRVSNASRFSFQLSAGSAAEELALEEKARRSRMGGEGVSNTLGDDEEEDDFDESAMDDMDEMEMQDDHGQGQGLSHLSLPVPNQDGQRLSAASTISGADRARVSQFLYRPATTTTTAKKRHAADSGRALQIDEADSGESEDDEEPYWMHEDFIDYSKEQSRHGSIADGATGGAPIANGTRSRGLSASSGLTLDTNVGRGTNLMPAQEPQRPERDSSGSERNRILSGMNFVTTMIDGSGRMTQHTPAMSSSTVGGSSSSEPRTLSTGLGLSGFSDFRFSDSAPATRSTSIQDGSKENRRTTDSMTIPHNVDWTAESSPAMKQMGRFSDGWNGRNERRPSSPLVLAKPIAAEDDMYFDDGGFDQDVNEPQRPTTSGGEVVDESAFDDDAFLSRKANTSGVPHTIMAQPRNRNRNTMVSLGGDGPYPTFAMPNPARARERDSRMLLEDLPLHAGPADPKLIPQRNPSEDAKRLGLSSRAPPLPGAQAKLEAYHAALAEAANRAAAEGRFLRVPSGKSGISDDGVSPGGQSETSVYSQPSRDEPAIPATEAELPAQPQMNPIAPIPPRLSFDFGFSSTEGGAIADDSDDAYDAFLNDDDIVAAANAEALASDDEGFYGQEFGFYAKARPNSGDLEAVNGGYFGPDGDDGLSRNKSLKEPNLTPITERSEFSTRNSFVFGPASAGGGPMSAVSPALARMPFPSLPLPVEEEEVMSFDQLRRLRAHAFGGSNGSLTGSSQSSLLLRMEGESPTLQSGRNSGALNYSAGMAAGYATDSSGSSHHHPQTQMFASADSPQSPSSGHLPVVEEKDVTPKRPITTNNNNNTDLPPLTTVKKAAPKAHSRNSSGADSVTYVKEQSPDGPPRWVLERRRTSETGLLELVGREVVQGGWI